MYELLSVCSRSLPRSCCRNPASTSELGPLLGQSDRWATRREDEYVNYVETELADALDGRYSKPGQRTLSIDDAAATPPPTQTSPVRRQGEVRSALSVRKRQRGSSHHLCILLSGLAITLRRGVLLLFPNLTAPHPSQASRRLPGFGWRGGLLQSSLFEFRYLLLSSPSRCEPDSLNALFAAASQRRVASGLKVNH